MKAPTSKRHSALTIAVARRVSLSAFGFLCSFSMSLKVSSSPLRHQKQILDFQNCFRKSIVAVQLSDLLSSSWSLSTTFLFWPLPAAASTSLAICARRIFLKSSCVRSLLPLMAAALATLSCAGIVWSFSACQQSGEPLAHSSATASGTAADSQGSHHFFCVFVR